MEYVADTWRVKDGMLVLGIESSCDETAAAVVRAGGGVMSSVVHTQIALHAPHGGVVPEIASRSHLEMIAPVIRKAVEDAGCTFGDIDAVAVTYGPGLASSLLVGLSAAKGLAAALSVPLVGIDHVAAHIQSAFLAPGSPRKRDCLPLLALVVSGGHSAIIGMGQDGKAEILGQTLDDAAGEAFDKASKLLGLGYPGGPAIQKAAAGAHGPLGFTFPQGRISPGNPGLGGLCADLCFSFSGLKTSLRTYLAANPDPDEERRCRIAAAYQDAIVEALASRCAMALKSGRYRAFAVGGGVSLNAALRARLREVADDAKVPLYLPEPKYCGDNAAMVAALACEGEGVSGEAAMRLDATPGLAIA